jgi:hypothetical protein
MKSRFQRDNLAQHKGLSNQKMGFGGTMEIQDWEGRRVGVPKIAFQLFIKLGRRHAVPPNQ